MLHILYLVCSLVVYLVGSMLLDLVYTYATLVSCIDSSGTCIVLLSQSNEYRSRRFSPGSVKERYRLQCMRTQANVVNGKETVLGVVAC